MPSPGKAVFTCTHLKIKDTKGQTTLNSSITKQSP